MNPYFLYFIKSFVSLGIFYFTWFLFLRKQIDFRFNRYYLLFTTLLAVFIPLLNLQELFPADIQNSIGQLSVVQLGEILIGRSETHTIAGTGLSWTTVFWTIYFMGVLIMTIRFVLNLWRLGNIVRKSETQKEGGITFVFTNGDLPVFSFFKFIFIKKPLLKNPKASVIINHEKTHVRQRHSIDILVLEIVSLFQWFNPFIYCIKRAVKGNHEFIADSGMAVSESSGNSYLKLLFSEASGFEFSPITHNFSYSLLKKRMIMMKNQKNQKRMPAKLLLTAFAISLTLLACNNSSQPTPKKHPKVMKVDKKGKVTFQEEMSPAHKQAIAVQIDTSKIFTVVEKMPEFPGGLKKLMQYLAKTIQYPEKAKKAKTQGRVFVNFVVEKDGSISHVKVLRGIGNGCDEEAVKAVANMPRWTPGYQRGKAARVSFNLPVKFSLNR